MIDINHSLERLARAPVPTKLAAIDSAVLAAISIRQQDSKLGLRLMGVAGMLALGIGMAAGNLTSDPAMANQPLSPFASASALAPSTLLVGGE